MNEQQRIDLDLPEKIDWDVDAPGVLRVSFAAKWAIRWINKVLRPLVDDTDGHPIWSAALFVWLVVLLAELALVEKRGVEISWVTISLHPWSSLCFACIFACIALLITSFLLWLGDVCLGLLYYEEPLIEWNDQEISLTEILSAPASLVSIALVDQIAEYNSLVDVFHKYEAVLQGEKSVPWPVIESERADLTGYVQALHTLRKELLWCAQSLMSNQGVQIKRVRWPRLQGYYFRAVRWDFFWSIMDWRIRHKASCAGKCWGACWRYDYPPPEPRSSGSDKYNPWQMDAIKESLEWLIQKIDATRAPGADRFELDIASLPPHPEPNVQPADKEELPEVSVRMTCATVLISFAGLAVVGSVLTCLAFAGWQLYTEWSTTGTTEPARMTHRSDPGSRSVPHQAPAHKPEPRKEAERARPKPPTGKQNPAPPSFTCTYWDRFTDGRRHWYTGRHKEYRGNPVLACSDHMCYVAKTKTPNLTSLNRKDVGPSLWACP